MTFRKKIFAPIEKETYALAAHNAKALDLTISEFIQMAIEEFSDMLDQSERDHERAA